MKMITKEIARKLPALYANEHKKPADVPVPLKIFNPYGAGTWYITEANLETGEAFGLCSILEPELGYVDLNELFALKVPPFGMKLERDMYWKGTLADAMRIEKYPYAEEVAS